MKRLLDFERLEPRVVLDGDALAAFDAIELGNVADGSPSLSVNEIDELNWERDFTTMGSFAITDELYSRSEEGTVWAGEWQAKVDIEKIAGRAENVRLTVNAQARVAMGSLAEGVQSELVVARMEINAEKIDPARHAYLDAAVTVENVMRMPNDSLSGAEHHWLTTTMRNFRIILDNPRTFSVVVSSLGLNQDLNFTDIGQSSQAFLGNSEVTVQGWGDRWVYQSLGGGGHYERGRSAVANGSLAISAMDGRGGFRLEVLGQARQINGFYGGQASDVDILSSSLSYKATDYHKYDNPVWENELVLYEQSPYWRDTWDDGYVYLLAQRQIGDGNGEWETIYGEFPDNADPLPFATSSAHYNSHDNGGGTLSLHTRLHLQAAEMIFSNMDTLLF